MASQRLTDAAVKALPAPAAGYTIITDRDVAGFGVRVTKAGAKSFTLDYRAAGRTKRLTIGTVGDWSLKQAREEAKRLKRLIDVGEDPQAERVAERVAPDVAALAARYLAEHAEARKRPRSITEDRAALRGLILPKLGKLRVAAVTRADIEQFHAALARTPTRANRALQLLSTMFGLAIRWELRADNPARGVPKFHENRRERYLTEAELERLMAALAGQNAPTPSANVVRLLLLTGARRGEVLSATWDQFDLAAGTWVKPAGSTKQNKLHRIPLSAPARLLLADMKARAVGPVLFPGSGASGVQGDLKRFWATLCRRAGITGLRVHDLRHSYASFLAGAGLSLPTIGALLGHSNPSTTSRYAHLADNPLRAATELVGQRVTDSAKSTAK